MGFLNMRTKIAVVLALLVVVPVTSLGLLALREQRSLVSKTVQEMNRGLTAMLASHIFRLLDSSRRQLEGLCAIPGVRNMDAGTVSVVLEQALSRNEIVDAVVIYDSSRRIIGQRGWGVRPGELEEIRESPRFFTDALLDRYGRSILEGEVSVKDTSPTVMSAMIYGLDGTIQGVLQARISRPRIRSTVDGLLDQVKEAYEDLDVYVVTQDGRIIMASRGAEYERLRLFPQDKVRRRAGFNPTVSLRRFQPYQTPDWHIWVVPRPSAMASLEQVRNHVLTISLVAMLAALLAGTIFVAGITRPINDLVKAALAISRGELSRPVTVRASDEIGKLAESFELMRQNLVRMQGHLKDRIEELQVLYGVGRALSTTLDLSQLLNIILDRVMSIMKGERGSIMLYDEEKDELHVEVSRGGPPGVVRGAKVKLGERVSGHVLQTGRALLIQDTEASPNLARLKEGEVASGTLLSVPLIIKDKRLGVLNVSKSTPFTFDEKDQELFTALANQGAIAIENARLYTLAITDELTRLFIRRFFYQRLREEMRRSLRFDKPLSVMVLDVDKFKNFNDTYGHQAGDEVLVHMARVMKESVRSIDLVARLGGEEFAILCPEQSEEEAAIPAERIRARLETTHLKLSSGAEVQITTSVGIAQFPRDGDGRDSLLDAGDQALYHAKRTGRNRVCFFRDLPEEVEVEVEVEAEAS